MEEYLQDFENSRLVVYTVIVGNYDTLKNPEYIDNNCDYICFTDNKELTSDTWTIQQIENTELDNTRSQRMYKVLAHRFLPEYEYSVYIDGNVLIIGSFRDFVKKQWKGSALLGLKHPSRDNIYDEAEACINFNKDSQEIIRKQINRYKSEGYLADNGLIASGILFRKHNDQKLIKVMENWWEEIRNNSRRDQLSFSYVCWKNHFIYDISELKCYKSDYWLNPGIHTNKIRDVENELIDHIQLVHYQQYLINEKDKSIALKEQEKRDILVLKEQEKVEALAMKEQEFGNTISLTEQEFKNAITIMEQEFESALAMKKREFDNAISLREQEFQNTLVLKEQEKAVAMDLKDQELELMNRELVLKSQELLDLKTKLEHMEHTLSWKYTAIFRKIFIKRK